MFRNTSEFLLQVDVSSGREGQDFEFTGWSEVVTRGSKVLVYPEEVDAKFRMSESIEAKANALQGNLFGMTASISLTLVVGSAIVGTRRWMRTVALYHKQASYTAYPCDGSSSE